MELHLNNYLDLLKNTGDHNIHKLQVKQWLLVICYWFLVISFYCLIRTNNQKLKTNNHELINSK